MAERRRICRSAEQQWWNFRTESKSETLESQAIDLETDVEDHVDVIAIKETGVLRLTVHTTVWSLEFVNHVANQWKKIEEEAR
ncbi:hypothetical protein Ccrd_010926 [Cynara cardunculus var. scolymus]|uniref:Uncharacterized protein n=1 Tax=Cynara cardunculus var. scolymus TaxID=59895 RepID=A0A118K6H7_CYNCS|nr:hypothetical protein Ccrd_010926 [Cynara cardunculus var. scolymus]